MKTQVNQTKHRVGKIMESASLELKLISCRNLKSFNFFQRPSVYASVCIFNDEPGKKHDQQRQSLQRQKTPVDREGGANPEWNHSMLFDLRSIKIQEYFDHLFLKFELRYEGMVLFNRTIGEVCVPFKDLISEFNGTVRHVSYQVRNSDRKANGVLNFSYKVNGKATKIVPVKAPNTDLSSGFNHSTEKVSYPSLEDEVPPRKTSLYPSLDDLLPPSPSTCMPSSQYYYPEKGVPTVPAPFSSQLPAFIVSNGEYCYPYPSQLTDTAGSYWHTKENSFWLRSA